MRKSSNQAAGAPERRYSIREVSELIEVPDYLLRQWEGRFSPLRPKRDHAGRRYYLAADIEVARRIKQLLRYEKMTTEGARARLQQELQGEGRPRTRKEAIELIDTIESEIDALLDILERD